jgi:hypothetical protein
MRRDAGRRLGYVKELVQPYYAQMYADAGFAALLFDYLNFGSSGGARRGHIYPNGQISGPPQRDVLRRAEAPATEVSTVQ